MMNGEIFNAGIQLSLEWGENWGKPINGRLMAQFPQLTPDDAAEYQRICNEARIFAFEQVERAYINEVSGPEASRLILERYPLLDDASISRLWQQGQYYAWRDHG